jgi:hypothetical protein
MADYYNTQFCFKYHTIQADLLAKVDRGENDGYTREDVLDICDKLYMDELCSAVGLEDGEQPPTADDLLERVKALLRDVRFNVCFEAFGRHLASLQHIPTDNDRWWEPALLLCVSPTCLPHLHDVVCDILHHANNPCHALELNALTEHCVAFLNEHACFVLPSPT